MDQSSDARHFKVPERPSDIAHHIKHRPHDRDDDEHESLLPADLSMSIHNPRVQATLRDPAFRAMAKETFDNIKISQQRKENAARRATLSTKWLPPSRVSVTFRHRQSFHEKKAKNGGIPFAACDDYAELYHYLQDLAADMFPKLAVPTSSQHKGFADSKIYLADAEATSAERLADPDTWDVDRDWLELERKPEIIFEFNAERKTKQIKVKAPRPRVSEKAPVAFLNPELADQDDAPAFIYAALGTTAEKKDCETIRLCSRLRKLMNLRHDSAERGPLAKDKCVGREDETTHKEIKGKAVRFAKAEKKTKEHSKPRLSAYGHRLGF